MNGPMKLANNIFPNTNGTGFGKIQITNMVEKNTTVEIAIKELINFFIIIRYKRRLKD
jgi:hypothetical protein